MAQFNYTLPSGATFTMQAPTGTTQDQADYTFYSQVAAGALVGFAPGQSVSGTTSSLAKFELSRLDRGTAGVDDTVILSIINGLPTVSDIPSLINVPLINPITQANIATIAGTGFTAPEIGTLTSDQTQALMAQIVNIVDQPATTMTDDTGVGQYGFSCQQLEIAGYVKPGTWQQFLQNGSSTLIDVLNAPGIWTGYKGVSTANEFLQNVNLQNDAQATLMENGYNSLQAAGVITTPATQSISAVRGTVYTGSNQALTTTTAQLTNSVNRRVAALVTNASVYGTAPTAQWATRDVPASSQIDSNLLSVTGIGVGLISQIPNLGSLTSGLTGSLPSLKTVMDNLGKASEFASTAASTLTSSLTNLDIGKLTANLPSVSSLLDRAEGQATALLTDAQAKLTGQANALLNQAQSQANALIAQIGGQVSALFGQVDSLVSSVEKAAGFANTVNRADVDVATTKILGSIKIPTPTFGPILPGSASIGAALDITQAQEKLKELQGQGTALLAQAQNQATELVGQGTALVSQVQGQITGTINQAQLQANNLVNRARNTLT